MGCSGSKMRETDKDDRKVNRGNKDRKNKKDKKDKNEKSIDKEKTGKEFKENKDDKDDKKDNKENVDKLKKISEIKNIDEDSNHNSKSDIESDDTDSSDEEVELNVQRVNEFYIERKPTIIEEIKIVKSERELHLEEFVRKLSIKPENLIQSVNEVIILETKKEIIIPKRPDNLIEKISEFYVERERIHPVLQEVKKVEIKAEPTSHIPIIKEEVKIVDDGILDLLKITFLGDKQCGKTQLINRFGYGKFEPDYNETLEAVEHTVILKTLNKVNSFKAVLIDNPGMQTPNYDFMASIKNAHIVVIVFDMTDAIDYGHACEFIKENKDPNEKDQIWVLLGNKLDLRDFRKTDKEVLNAFSEKYEVICDEISSQFKDNNLDKTLKKGSIKSFFKSRVYPAAHKKWKLY